MTVPPEQIISTHFCSLSRCQSTHRIRTQLRQRKEFVLSPIVQNWFDWVCWVQLQLETNNARDRRATFGRPRSAFDAINLQPCFLLSDRSLILIHQVDVILPVHLDLILKIKLFLVLILIAGIQFITRASSGCRFHTFTVIAFMTT